MRLNRKILIFTISILALSLAVGSVVNILSFRANYTDALLTGSFGVGHSIESVVKELLALGLPLESLSGMDEKLAEVVKDNAHIAYADIQNPDGKVVFHSHPEMIGRVLSDDVSLQTLKTNKPIWQLYHRFDGRDYYDVALPLFDGDQRIGVIRIGFPVTVIDDKIMQAAYQLLINGLITFLLIAVLLNFFLRRQVTEPIRQLSKYAESIAQGLFHPSVRIESKDEIGLLSGSLERMAHTLKIQIEALQTAGQELEGKVQARTGQLAQTNQTLQESNNSLKQALQRERDLTLALSRSEERFRMLFEKNQASMLIIDPQDGRIIAANKAAVAYYGYTHKELVSLRISNINTLSKAEINREMQLAQKEKRNHFYFRHILASNEVRDVEVHSGPIDWDGKPVLYSIVHDVTARKQAEAELEHIAHYDALTGLPNRLLKTDRLRQAIAQSRRRGTNVAVCYLDLDGFKPINDTYGHDVGDQILVETGRRLLKTVREGDTVSRIGGDEFVLILTELSDVDQCKQILERVLHTISIPIVVDEQPVEVYASIGLTLFPQDDVDADMLMRHADQAMYVAKERGRNRYHVFDPEQDKQVKAHRESYRQLEMALSQDEFILHYQPKVNMFTCEVIGVEALIRWNHPHKGLLYPGDFLYYMSNTDLEIALGNWVISTALKQITSLRDMGLDLPVSINIGAHHLQSPGLVDFIREQMVAYPELKSGDLEFEILESASIEDMSDIYHTLVACRAMGIRFSLDDFGTGYSSLAYFHRLPVDILKIDQSFVQDMLEDPQDLTIVDSVVRMAEAFQHPVIAEGVESLEHAAALLELGCQLGQGYGIARPMPLEELPAWLESWQRNEAWQSLKSRFVGGDGIDIQAAVASHRQWVRGLVESLQSQQPLASVQLDSRHCAFGRWFHGMGYVHYGHLPVYDEIRHVHEVIHKLGQSLIELSNHGSVDQALVRVGELEKMRDRFIELVESLYGAQAEPQDGDRRALGGRS
jgi:diguanylate cyclase (GGDEF)-like protein/PAS domain S-box-containing protein